MKRTAKAHLEGTVKEGKGALSAQSQILDQTNYSFRTCFVCDNKWTNPEELLAAAHAGCFTMAVSYALTEKGLNPISLDTEGVVSINTGGITGIHLSIIGDVAGVSAEDFVL